MLGLVCICLFAPACSNSGDDDDNAAAAADDDSGGGTDDDSTNDDDDAADDDNDDNNDDTANDCGDYSDALPDPEGACTGNPNSLFPALTGPYCVGTTAPIHLIDESRNEPFTPDIPAARREMMIQIWYPVDQGTTGERAPYIDPVTAAYEASIPPAAWVDMPAEAFLQIQPHALLDAPFAAGLKKFPLLLFSPGLKREYFNYAALIENMVSHGYIIVTINHPYISGITVFPDGRSMEVVLPADEAGSFDLVVGDARFVLDTLVGWNTDFSGDPRFTCRMDLDKAAMFGHSYGGSTAVGAAVLDSRLRAALNLDGPTFGAVVNEGTHKPLFFMISDEHLPNPDPDLESAWQHLSGPGFQAEVSGTAHMSFSDYPVLLHDFAPSTPLWLLDMGTIDPLLALEITNRYEQTFFDVYLKSAPVDDLLAVAGDYQEITFQSKNVAN